MPAPHSEPSLWAVPLLPQSTQLCKGVTVLLAGPVGALGPLQALR